MFNQADQQKVIVAIYVRVSTEEQADNFSIPAQLELLRSYCRAMSYEIYDEYVDAGFSGTTSDRPALGRLIDDAKTGKFQVILVYRIDRFFRSVKDLLFVVDYLDKLGVSFRSVTEPFDTTNPIGKFMLSLLGSIAQLERDTFIERSMMGKIRRAEEGYVVLSSPPYGYDYIMPFESGRKSKSEKGYLVVNNDEAQVVKEIFLEYIKPDQSTITVAKYLAQKGYKTKRGGRWGGERVYSILTNTAYIGEWRYKDISVSVPPIIDIDTFETAQKLLKERKNMIHRVTPRDYLLRGLLRCKKCGKYMGGTTQMHRHYKNGKRVGDPYKETYYYRCITSSLARRRGMDESCPAKWVKGENIETKVLNYLSEILSNPAKLNEALSAQQENVRNKKADTEKKLKELDKTMYRLANERERILEAYRSGVIELSDLQKSIEDIKSRQKTVEQQINEIKLSLIIEEEKSKNVFEIVEKHRNNWEAVHSLSFEEKRELLIKTVKCIWVETSPDGNVVLDIECYLPASEEQITTPPLASHEPGRFR
ncbi:site-specific DNA recombinase [Desulforamulus putei DSM 12395]|uniref:Site-specific DNA recombinase n=1 Tax=Desulforamulus putei DSM 12395 TaxID=1121429 RepID=A0A1M5BX14_9FIRM|nr:recombinase family protein [Desulforamulus putei]SHF47058.1 site-specific DNA recombinase [Desulforamulus putei DSM 12395]